jgi:hypothetical protein
LSSLADRISFRTAVKGMLAFCVIENRYLKKSVAEEILQMSKPVIGLVVGAVLGIFDGLTAWFTPEVRPEMLGIVIGSTFKGIIAGLIMGVYR